MAIGLDALDETERLLSSTIFFRTSKRSRPAYGPAASVMRPSKEQGNQLLIPYRLHFARRSMGDQLRIHRRPVTENSRTLRFTSQGFEAE